MASHQSHYHAIAHLLLWVLFWVHLDCKCRDRRCLKNEFSWSRESNAENSQSPLPIG